MVNGPSCPTLHPLGEKSGFRPAVWLIIIAGLFAACSNDGLVLQQPTTLALESAIEAEANLVTTLVDFNDHINTLDSMSNGELFLYWLNHPDATLTELESFGYIDSIVLVNMAQDIHDLIVEIDDEEVVWGHIAENIDGRYYSARSEWYGGDNPNPPVQGLKIFRWTGISTCCFKGDDCYSFLPDNPWRDLSWGKGC